jgi:hypothetical protein
MKEVQDSYPKTLDEARAVLIKAGVDSKQIDIRPVQVLNFDRREETGYWALTNTGRERYSIWTPTSKQQPKYQDKLCVKGIPVVEIGPCFLDGRVQQRVFFNHEKIRRVLGSVIQI